VLGWDIATGVVDATTSPGRDIAFVERGQGVRDFLVVDGIDNLGQALTLALTTVKGGDVFNVDYGFDGLLALVEENSPFMQRERIRVSVVQTVTRDPRVRRIIDLEVAPPPETSTGVERRLSVRLTIESQLGQSVQVTVAALGTPVNS
jgi:phage baseplate assembly protein W